jgi:hypothetical protein
MNCKKSPCRASFSCFLSIKNYWPSFVLLDGKHVQCTYYGNDGNAIYWLYLREIKECNEKQNSHQPSFENFEVRFLH